MYQEKTSTFASLTCLTVFKPDTESSLTIIPALGGHLQKAVIRGVSLVDGIAEEKEITENKYFKSALLYPFPNRLKNGTYSLGEETFQFPVNDETGNALHGLGVTKKIEIQSVNCTEQEGSIHLRYNDPGIDPAYPFPFVVDVFFTLSDKIGVEMEMSFQNFANHAIPVGLGWHPYFTLRQSLDTLELQLPACTKVVVDETMIPTGERISFTEFTKSKLLAGTHLDDGFALPKAEGKVEVVLRNDKYKLHFWQETGEGKFNFIQLFTPPLRKSIAIEPMTCNIDAFNNGEGLILLEPGQILSTSAGFYLKS